MSKIKVNDELQEVKLPLTLTELIRQNDILQPDMVSVSVNGEFIPREDFDRRTVRDNDEIDFLYFMGGGR
ncbi:MAG: sulfur carrier protein ThiS [Tannerella sp.]|jgi:sulfur carrier protein|nr:sulfur carrier protein ThiS [Tannerella sp.]